MTTFAHQGVANINLTLKFHKFFSFFFSEASLYPCKILGTGGSSHIGKPCFSIEYCSDSLNKIWFGTKSASLNCQISLTFSQNLQ